MGKIIGWIIVLVIIIGGFYYFTGEKATAPVVSENETGPIKIGFISPLTGDASSIGVVNKDAAEIAVSEVNARGGINGRSLELIYEDGKCNATSAVSAAQKLISADKVSVILGGTCSTETAAFGPNAMQNKVIVLSQSSSAPNLSKLGKYFFRSYPSDNFQGKFAAEYAYNTLKARKVAIMYHVSDWGTGIKTVFIDRFKELGGEIVAEEGATQESKDYRTSLSKIKAVKPDLIFAPTYPNGGQVMILQARDQGIAAPILGADGWDDPKLWKAVSGKGSIMYTVAFSPTSDEFKAKIKTKTGKDDVPVGTQNSYDNVMIVAQIMSKVGTDTDKIQEEMRKIEYDGVSGHISFDQNGDLKTAKYVVKKMENGTSVEVK